jgi:Tfp pilus assembly protein PilO
MVIVVGAAIFLGIFLILLIGLPLYNNLKQTNTELKSKKAVLEKLENNLTNLKNLDSRKTELEAKNEKVLSALPQDKDIPRLFIQLERIASAAGLQINTVSESGGALVAAPIGESTTSAQPNVIQINPVYYQVTGSATNYAALKAALTKAEDGLRLISIDKLDIQSTEAGKPITVNFIVKTYSRGQN